MKSGYNEKTGADNRKDKKWESQIFTVEKECW